jgi:hypothetical protein
MKKSIVISILAILMLTLLSANLTQAVDPNLSVQPQLIQDHDMKPADPPPESHPTAHQYTAPVTDPVNSYDNDDETYSLTNITQQAYPSVYSRPSAYSGNATWTNPTYAYDLNLNSFAALAIEKTRISGKDYAYMREFNVTTLNTTAITTISSVDIHIKHNLTFTGWGSSAACWYGFVLYVGTSKVELQPLTMTQINITTTTGSWIAVTEPNDGIWSGTDVGNIKIGIRTRPNATVDVGTLRAFEVWARIYSPVVKYFDVRAFNPTAIPSFSYLNVEMHYSAILGRSAYRILISVGSANTTVQDWVDVSQIVPATVVWEEIAEPNDGWWSQADLSNLKIIIETQKIESEYNNGEVYIYEAWVTIDPPTVNSYPSTNSGTASVTSPTNAYDKNQMTYATINAPATTSWVYFTVTTFNVTTLKDYATINIRMKYDFTAWRCQYRIYLQVGSLTLDLQPSTTVNQTTPILKTWIGVCEPNDGIWSLSDLTNMQIRVAARRTLSSGSYSFSFREYETWTTIPDATFTVRVSITGVVSSAPLYGWQFNLTFNPAVLQAEIVSEGPFLKQAGVTQFAGYTISNTAGWVFAGCAVDDWFGGGVYGSGTLATITFQTISKGNSMFNFTDTQLRSFDEVYEIPVPLAHTTSPGWFQYLLGDVNGDAIVDACDLRQLGKAYGTTSGSPSYNADADQDKDADVDAADLATVSSHYGDT